MAEGDAVGPCVGMALGDPDGAVVGVDVGAVGESVGLAVGAPDGADVGLADGDALGFAVGDLIGEAVGELVGDADGTAVGLSEGATVGGKVGASLCAATHLAFLHNNDNAIARAAVRNKEHVAPACARVMLAAQPVDSPSG
jgi:hypothetical protein